MNLVLCTNKFQEMYPHMTLLGLNDHLFLFFQTEPFQKPVSLEQHPDYAEYIFHPMDLCTLEKVKHELSHIVHW